MVEELFQKVVLPCPAPSSLPLLIALLLLLHLNPTEKFLRKSFILGIGGYNCFHSFSVLASLVRTH